MATDAGDDFQTVRFGEVSILAEFDDPKQKTLIKKIVKQDPELVYDALSLLLHCGSVISRPTIHPDQCAVYQGHDLGWWRERLPIVIYASKAYQPWHASQARPVNLATRKYGTFKAQKPGNGAKGSDTW